MQFSKSFKCDLNAKKKTPLKLNEISIRILIESQPPDSFDIRITKFSWFTLSIHIEKSVVLVIYENLHHPPIKIFHLFYNQITDYNYTCFLFRCMPVKADMKDIFKINMEIQKMYVRNTGFSKLKSSITVAISMLIYWYSQIKKRINFAWSMYQNYRANW